jgi:hypothetical protein
MMMDLGDIDGQILTRDSRLRANPIVLEHFVLPTLKALRVLRM